MINSYLAGETGKINKYEIYILTSIRTLAWTISPCWLSQFIRSFIKTYPAQWAFIFWWWFQLHIPISIDANFASLLVLFQLPLFVAEFLLGKFNTTPGTDLHIPNTINTLDLSKSQIESNPQAYSSRWHAIFPLQLQFRFFGLARHANWLLQWGCTWHLYPWVR